MARARRGIRAARTGLRVHAARARRLVDAAARITREALESAVVPASERPRVFVCGSTGFVERVADWLVELGHEPRSIRTERYGGT